MPLLRAAHRSRREQGFALAAVLGFILIISAFLSNFAVSSRVHMLTTSNIFEETKARWAIEALLTEVAREYAQSTLASTVYSPFNLREAVACQAGPVAISLRLQEHSGLIDLNAASVELLALGYQSLGLDAEVSQRLAEQTDQYRNMTPSPDPLPIDGAVADGYKHAAFEDVRELYDFEPLRAFAQATLMQTFTVFTKSGTLSAENLPEKLHAAINASGQKAEAWLVHGAAGSRVITVEMWIQSRKTAPKYAAAIFRLFGDGADVRQLTGVAPMSTDTSPRVQVNSGCATIFGYDVARLLQRTFD